MRLRAGEPLPLIELKCPSPDCGELMGVGRPYVTLAAALGIRSMSQSYLQTREPNGYVFDCPKCGCKVDIPTAA